MLDSPILDVGIGLLLVYLIFGLICSAINEHITQMLSLRADMLWAGVRALLADHHGEGIAKEIYNSPFVLSISSRLAPLKKPKAAKTNGGADSPEAEKASAAIESAAISESDPWKRAKPSYIPADVFSLALIQNLTKASHPVTFDKLENGIKTCGLHEDVKSSLLHLIHAADKDLSQARKNIEAWYNAGMDRTSGWFKQRVQVMLLAIGFVVAFAMNADTLMMADRLWANKAERAALTAQAGRVTALPDTASAAGQDSLKGLIGWANDPGDPRHAPAGPIGWMRKIIGVGITAFAASLGAPFWFGILRKFMDARSAAQTAVSSTVTTAAAAIQTTQTPSEEHIVTAVVPSDAATGTVASAKGRK